MSRNPGIGTWWFEKHARDLFGSDRSPHDFAVLDGEKRRVPRFYWRKYQVSGDPFVVEELHEARLARAREVDPVENTVERRAVKEEAAFRRLRTFSPRNSHF